MPNTKTITGIQRGPDFEREAHEIHHVERIQREVKTNSKAEVNEPLIRAAVEAGQEIGQSMGNSVDVKYDRENDLVVMQITSADGEEVIRQIPPEDAIRTAQRIKKQQAQFWESIM
ncbi:MAG: flagellar protein FlaG [Deltaproteobacteria bacterium]|nr:flagellar protein FlaG [Deltaproteobacteria bacterium]MBN2671690.1 flagellar protein FlaG [Deltaproteobacteria bacterium]